MKVILNLLLLISINWAFSQENLVDYSAIKHINVNADYAKITRVGDEDGAASEFEIETFKQPKFIYNCATAIPINNQNFKKDRVFLLSFDAKTTKSSLETGEAKVNLMFRQSNSYKDNIVHTQSIASEWQTYHVPFQATKYIHKDDIKIVMQYGFKPQTFLIKNLKFEVYPEGTDIASLPKTKITYMGMEPDANWRKAAINRIESIRKGDFKIQLVKNDKPVVGKTINIKLVAHHFSFGGAINAKDVVENGDAYNHFKQAFNAVVLANDLKIKAWRFEPKVETALKALDILNNDGYKVKGHVLIWPGFNYLTPEFRQNKDNPEEIKTLMQTHLDRILDATKGKVSRWDVVNEAYTNRDLQRITGSEDILFNGFNVLKEKQPNVLAFTNEYGIISKGGIDSKKQQWYYNFVKRIDKNTNGKIDGVGIQCHMGTDLTSPERVIRLLNYYATLGKKISISEFTMDVEDPEIREQYTRDFMIAAFSHPSVSEFIFWGYVMDNRKKVDVFNNDWTAGAMGKAYFGLVHDTWKTNLSSITNHEGVVSGRGFYGTYEYSYVNDGKLQTGTFNLTPNGSSFYKLHVE